MVDGQTAFVLTTFFITVLFLLWRPFGINESLPTSVGAGMILFAGIVSLMDAYRIIGIVSGASITIISTIIMSIVLESLGFFRWASINLAKKAKGSGIALFWYVNLLCFLMTLFFNNDGSILITTPIIIQTLTLLNLKPHQKIPYLFSGAIIATASSAPIGVSNLANLIALEIVGLELNTYAAMMFIPSMMGIITIAWLLFVYFRKNIPEKIPILPYWTEHSYGLNDPSSYKRFHPLSIDTNNQASPDWGMFRLCITIVVLIRASFFALAPLGISTEILAIIGAVLLILLRWCRTGEGPYDILKKTPWHVLLFAFSMYVIIYGLHNVGLTSIVVQKLGEPISSGRFEAVFIVGFLLTLLSNICNNLPSVMIGTLSLTEMGLDPTLLQIAYLAAVIGADVGALLLPIGTLASLIWMYLLRKNQIPFSWGQYFKATIVIIPAGLLVSLMSLYLWTGLFF